MDGWMDEFMGTFSNKRSILYLYGYIQVSLYLLTLLTVKISMMPCNLLPAAVSDFTFHSENGFFHYLLQPHYLD